MLRAIGLFDGMMRELVEMQYLLTDPVILDDTAIHELLGPLHKTSYDDAVRAICAPAAAVVRSGPVETRGEID